MFHMMPIQRLDIRFIRVLEVRRKIGILSAALLLERHNGLRSKRLVEQSHHLRFMPINLRQVVCNISEISRAVQMDRAPIIAMRGSIMIM